MKAKLVGIQRLDYVNKQGKAVKGTSLHIVHPGSKVDGEVAESLYISDLYAVDIKAMPNLKPGLTVDIEYNRFGGVENVVIQ